MALLLEKHQDFYFFQITTRGEYFYDDYSEFIKVQHYRHSTLLEFIWATFPTIIIILILIPSLFLLYSLDEDFYPEFTLKVIGHQ
jgi:heme/copper-type cytochrome/quinol oxidase subunit 2